MDNTYTRRFLLFIAAGTTLAVAIGILVWKLGSPQTIASNTVSDAGPQKLEEAAVTSSSSAVPQAPSSTQAPAASSPQDDSYAVHTPYPVAPNRAPQVRHDPLMPPNAHVGTGGKAITPTTTVSAPSTPQPQTTTVIPETDSPVVIHEPEEETSQSQSSQPPTSIPPVVEGSSSSPGQSSEKPDQSISSTSAEPSPAPTEIITEPTAPLVDPSTVRKALSSAGTLLNPHAQPRTTAPQEAEPKPAAPVQTAEKAPVPQP
ncbi:hypothetical protein AY498_10165 [Corynebacterium ulcerans]|uniref:Secreted protein n=1 Tax=Corynebacterium ulcerans TaxID=65058 RepID=A0ABD7MTH3_CORUL|nr:hypothetical protein [Corynebacterium ulcerans]AIT88555.1 Hypothetical protein Cul210932_0591 [Corynebacterium ulcerans]ALD94324.1 Hypothetical protein Cul131001_0599 [Corynebacterium ulcerans]PME07987.1 hypothetical protein AY498_10165 [Corynebacterium ulcerans]QQU26025.1 hypothetical protein I6I75_01510 [Corynebacterium ulcerans]SNV13134.1 putative secreted protein [Corynebacterium ulcerans]